MTQSRGSDQAAQRLHIYLSSNFWDGLWIIQQPTCNEIRRDELVLYVERFVSIFAVLRYPELWRRLFAWLRGARRLENNLWVLAPLPLFHIGHRAPWLFRLEFSIQRRWISWWVARLPRGVRVLWMDNPLYSCAVGRMGEATSVYHVADEVSAFPTSHAATMRMLEQQLLRNVGVVFAAAEQLAADKRRWQSNTHTVWNAIDQEVFGAEVQVTPPRALVGIPAPWVAFVGVLDSWVDLDLLRTAVKDLPDVHFLIIGPTRVDIAALRDLPNAHLLGKLERHVIPAILRNCAASLVALKKNAVTERILPLKVFEALAAGALPVCTPFSVDLNKLAADNMVVVAHSTEEFVTAIRSALVNDDLKLRRQRVEYGLQQTWKRRWAQMKQVIDQDLRAH